MPFLAFARATALLQSSTKTPGLKQASRTLSALIPSRASFGRPTPAPAELAVQESSPTELLSLAGSRTRPKAVGARTHKNRVDRLFPTKHSELWTASGVAPGLRYQLIQL